MTREHEIIRERYKIIEEIARGGMGVVYLAADLLTNGKVALKTNTWSGEQKTQKAFETEAKLLARLNHKGLPKVRDYFTLDGNYQALVMDFVEGKTLVELLESEKYRNGVALDAGIIVDWGIQILDILGYLHSFTPPVIHRDIKPNNIKLKNDGTIVLLDFGLAKGTDVSVVSGSSHYSSLEQLNLAATDARSDIYALGTTLYHLLTNYQPLNALNRFQVFYRSSSNVSVSSVDQTSLQNDPQKTVSEINPNVPPEISEIVRKAMSLFPEDRFQSAGEMKSALQTAKQNLGDSLAAFTNNLAGASTHIDVSGMSGGLKSLLDDEEEQIGVWSSNVENNSNFNRDNPQISPNAEEIAPTRFVSQPAAFHSNDEHTTFEVNRPPEQKTAHKSNKKTMSLIFGVLGLIALLLFGFVGWLVLSPKTVAEKSETSKSEESGIAPLTSGKIADNPIKISTYSVKKDGTETKLDGNHLFENDEQFRFGVKSENAGYLYVISRNNQDKAQLAYPLPNQVDNSIKKNSESPFPRDDGKFQFDKDSPSEMWAYFVVVESRENAIAKRIRTTLGGNKEKNLSNEEVGNLLKELDEIADDLAKNKKDSTEEMSVEIVKLQKK